MFGNNNTPERVVRLFICAPLLLAACSAGGDDVPPERNIQVVGNLENTKLDEASGLARSNRNQDLYWAINDDGPPIIYALDSSGANLGTVRIATAKNRDWEDIASFLYNGKAYLAVADIGDNDARHDNVTVYIVEEPAPSETTVEIAWRIDFSYPNGAQDAESLAVDAIGEEIYVLSKRTVPAVLYRLPLAAPAQETVIATRVAELDSLPQPSRRELRDAAGSGWGWQPTGMDFAADGRSALILTYAGVNYFSRDEQQSWSEALQGQAMHLKLGEFKNAESITYTTDGAAALVTVEKKHAPVLSISLHQIDEKK
jgi:hypothetical protein